MFNEEIVKKNFPLKKILDLENCWSKTESKTRSKTRSKTKLDWENFHPKFWRNCEKKISLFVAKSLKMSCLMEKL